MTTEKLKLTNNSDFAYDYNKYLKLKYLRDNLFSQLYPLQNKLSDIIAEDNTSQDINKYEKKIDKLLKKKEDIESEINKIYDKLVNKFGIDKLEEVEQYVRSKSMNNIRTNVVHGKSKKNKQKTEQKKPKQKKPKQKKPKGKSKRRKRVKK